MVTVDDVRAVATELPRAYEVLVHDRVKFRVGAIVFDSTEELAWLESLLHPLVAERTAAWRSELPPEAEDELDDADEPPAPGIAGYTQTSD